ncbi:MAG: nuclear transport factor 2 family protein [Thermoanaerobaculia bacterium]|nr:nuclear transport factor 2 family protein [Thermoanaerobaculia bacterium]
MNLRTSLPLVLLTTLCVLVSVSAAETSDGAERAAIQKVVEDFAGGADARDVDRIGRSLHAESRQYLPTSGGLRVFDREQYLGLISAGKIGGQQRKMTVRWVEVIEGYLATVGVELRGGGMVFLHHFGLMKVDDTWQILSILTLAGREE